MVDISNKTMALLLVAAMFVSLGGTMVTLNTLGSGITGFATTDQGTASINITGDLSIEFTTAEVDFGTGYTNDSGGGMEQCIISTDGTAAAGDCVDFTTPAGPFVIENIGNQDASLNIDFNGATANSFIGGTGAAFEYRMVDIGGTASCTTGVGPTTFTDVSTTPADVCNGTGVGTGFLFADGDDELELHINVSIPQDAPVAANTATITATAS